MRFTNENTIQSNAIVRWKNKHLRYNSLEEREFTIAGTAGMFLMWDPYLLSQDIKENALIDEGNENSSSILNKQIGLPAEIGQLIGSYLNRKDAASVAQVCRDASKSAFEAKESYIKSKGKSFEEEPCLPLLRFF